MTRPCKFHARSSQRGEKFEGKYVKFIFSLKFFAPGIDHTNSVYSKGDQERVYKNCKFYDPQDRSFYDMQYSENAIFPFESAYLLLSKDQTN